MREFRDFKLKALIKAIMSAQEELAQLFAKLQSAGKAEAEAVPNLHGNIKATNIFIENAGQNIFLLRLLHYTYILLSFRALQVDHIRKTLDGIC